MEPRLAQSKIVARFAEILTNLLSPVTPLTPDEDEDGTSAAS